MKSPIYSHPKLYQFAIRRLYHDNFEERYDMIARLIPENCSVAEVCIGDCYLYKNYLIKKNVDYWGGDINEVFVRSARRQGINAHFCDVRKDPIPPADIVLMQGSLFYFIPEHRATLDKLLASARQKVIISEAVNNVSVSKNKLLAWAAQWMSSIGGGQVKERFDKFSFLQLMNEYAELLESTLPIHGGREWVAVLNKGRLGSK